MKKLIALSELLPALAILETRGMQFLTNGTLKEPRLRIFADEDGSVEAIQFKGWEVEHQANFSAGTPLPLIAAFINAAIK
jgi:hypothetical protein